MLSATCLTNLCLPQLWQLSVHLHSAEPFPVCNAKPLHDSGGTGCNMSHPLDFSQPVANITVTNVGSQW